MVACISQVRSKLLAALYMGLGKVDKASFFSAADKSHTGFLDLSEVRGVFRRVLKFTTEELGDDQVRHVKKLVAVVVSN